jgi:hypothetical protein
MGMDSREIRVLRNTHDRNAELRVDVSSEAWETGRIQVYIPVHDEHRERACPVADSAYMRELTTIELSWTIRLGSRTKHRPLADHRREP